MEVDGGIHETLGRVVEAVRQLQLGQAEMKTSISEVQQTLFEVRGGWRVILWLGGSAAAAGAFIGAYFDNLTAFFHRGHP